MTIAPNRAVAALTPLVFAPAAGAVSVWLAKHAPGVEIGSGSLEAIFIAGATIAFAKAGLWLKGWQDYEKREQAFAHDASANATQTTETETDLEDESILDMYDEIDYDTDADGFAPDAELNGELVAGLKG